MLIDRIPHGESITKGRSYCDHCKKPLKWYDLIPVFSFLLLSGRCRYCRKKISLQYPLVELATGLLFIFVYWWDLGRFMIYDLRFTNVIELFYLLFITSSFIVIFVTDLKYGIIPDKIIFPGIFVSLFYLILNTPYLILGYFLSAIGAFLFFLALFLLTKGKGMGFGDVKLAFLLGLILGFPGIVVAGYTAFLTGAVVSTILVLWGKKRFFGGTIPFGPFLILGAFSGVFFKDFLIEKALGFLLLI